MRLFNVRPIAAIVLSVGIMQSSLNGVWQGEMAAPAGTKEAIAFTLKVDGEKVTGTIKTSRGVYEIGDGRSDGTKVNFKQMQPNSRAGTVTYAFVFNCEAVGDQLECSRDNPAAPPGRSTTIHFTVKKASPATTP